MNVGASSAREAPAQLKVGEQPVARMKSGDGVGRFPDFIRATLCSLKLQPFTSPGFP